MSATESVSAAPGVMVTAEATGPTAAAPASAISASATPAPFNLRQVLVMSTGHMLHDSYPAFLGTLLPLLIEKLSLTFALAGSLIMFMRAPLLLQPIIGYYSDKTDPRYWVILTPTLSALGVCLLGLAPNYLVVVVLLVMTGLSVAAFHPGATALATEAAGAKRGQGTSFFMTGGELGRAIGPLFIAAIVAAVGFEGSWIAVAPAIGCSLLFYFTLGKRPHVKSAAHHGGGMWAVIRAGGRPLALVSGIILLRSVATTSFATFFPTFLKNEIGTELAYAALSITIFEVFGAVGAFMGGTLSDRFGRKQVILTSQLCAAPLLFLSLMFAGSGWGLAALAFGGLFSLSIGSVILALIIELMPSNRGMASGLMMFLGFEGTLIATIPIGWIADQIGLGSTLMGSVWLSLLSIPLTLSLPETREGYR